MCVCGGGGAPNSTTTAADELNLHCQQTILLQYFYFSNSPHKSSEPFGEIFSRLFLLHILLSLKCTHAQIESVTPKPFHCWNVCL